MGRVKAWASVQKGQSRAPSRPALGHQGSGPLALCCFLAQPSKGLPIAQDEVPDLPASWDSLIATCPERLPQPLTASLQQKNSADIQRQPLRGSPRRGTLMEGGRGKAPGASTCGTRGHLTSQKPGSCTHPLPGPLGLLAGPTAPTSRVSPASVLMHYMHLSK